MAKEVERILNRVNAILQPSFYLKKARRVAYAQISEFLNLEEIKKEPFYPRVDDGAVIVSDMYNVRFDSDGEKVFGTLSSAGYSNVIKVETDLTFDTVDEQWVGGVDETITPKAGEPKPLRTANTIFAELLVELVKQGEARRRTIR